MRPPCYSVLEKIVILEVIYGSLVWSDTHLQVKENTRVS